MEQTTTSAFSETYKNYINSCIDSVNSVGGSGKILYAMDYSIVIDAIFDKIAELDRNIFLDNESNIPEYNKKSEKIFPPSGANSDNFDDILSDKTSNNRPPGKTTNKAICVECCAIDSMIEDEKHCCIVCSKCGCQQEELLESGPEWHQYNNDDGRGEGVNRCGSTTSYYFPKSSQGTIITGFNHSRLNRKQKWNSTVYKENTLNKDFDIITEICSKNKISKRISDTAKFFYKQISDCKHKSGKNIDKQVIIRGQNRDCIILACVYKACETNRDPRPKKEIALMLGKQEKQLSRGIKRFEKIIKDCDDMNILENIHDGTPEDHIRKYCSKLTSNILHIELAIRISNNCAKLKLATDHGAQSIGAGVTLLMVNYFNLNIEKKDIAYWFKISDVTITKIYNKIVPYTKAIVDDDITEHIIKKFQING